MEEQCNQVGLSPFHCQSTKIMLGDLHKLMSGRSKFLSHISHWIWGSFCYCSLIWFLTNTSDHMRLIIKIMISNYFDWKDDLISLQHTLLGPHPSATRWYKFKKRFKVWFMAIDFKSRKYSQVVKPAQFSLAASFWRYAILHFKYGLFGMKMLWCWKAQFFHSLNLQKMGGPDVLCQTCWLLPCKDFSCYLKNHTGSY